MTTQSAGKRFLTGSANPLTSVGVWICRRIMDLAKKDVGIASRAKNSMKFRPPMSARMFTEGGSLTRTETLNVLYVGIMELVICIVNDAAHRWRLTMADLMTFPNTVEEFMEQYKITDTEQIYTNGADLVPIFRMKQWFEHCSERKKGKWVAVKVGNGMTRYTCSECGVSYECDSRDVWDFIFCPKCGVATERPLWDSLQ